MLAIDLAGDVDDDPGEEARALRRELARGVGSPE